MPLFDFRCTACEHVFEVRLTSGAAQDTPTCPECGTADVERIWSPVASRTSGCGSMSGFS